MFQAMERRELTALYVIGENPVQSEADQAKAIAALSGLEHLVVQDIFLTRTAAAGRRRPARPPPPGPRPRARSRTPSGASSACARRCEPPGEARDDLAIIFDLARRLGGPADWGEPSAEAVWNEVRSALARPRRA